MFNLDQLQVMVTSRNKLKLSEEAKWLLKLSSRWKLIIPIRTSLHWLSVKFSDHLKRF